jgi:hypothetical protein
MIDLCGLRATLQSVDQNLLGSSNPATISLQIPSEVGEEWSEESVPGFTFTARSTSKGLDLTIAFEREQNRGRVWSVEVEGKLDESDEWQTVVLPEKHGRIARSRFLMIGAAPEENSAFRELFWQDPGSKLDDDSPVLQLSNNDLKNAVVELARLLAWKYPTDIWSQNASRLRGITRKVSTAVVHSGGSARSYWWQWAVKSLADHSREAQPIVIPELPILHGVELLGSRLKGCDLEDLEVDNLVSRSFWEVCCFENRSEGNNLPYLNDALGSGRVDPVALSHFGGMANLHQGLLRSPNLKDWSAYLYDKCKSRTLELDDGTPSLLSVDHYIRCLTKAQRRCEVLDSVSSGEEGHWLSEPISMLKRNRGSVEVAVSDLTRDLLHGAPAEMLWKPFTETSLFSEAGHCGEIMQALLSTSFLAALVFRQHAAGRISTAKMADYLTKLTGGD